MWTDDRARAPSTEIRRYLVGVFGRQTFLAVAVIAAIGTASLAAAAGNSIGGPAVVSDAAERVAVPDPVPMSPAERAVGDMITLINVDRGNRGLPVLEVHDQVMAAARAHAADMASMRSMQHTGSDGSDAGDRLLRYGFDWGGWGENIGAGFDEPEPLLAAWLASPAHRRNLLGDFEYLGVGVVEGDGVPYWSLVVATAS
jgi:uncharacterized protein YkwD